MKEDHDSLPPPATTADADDAERLIWWQRARMCPVLRPEDATTTILLRAITKGMQVGFFYLGGSQPWEFRVVRPMGLFRREGYTEVYLDAFCFRRWEERAFRVDRISWDAGCF